MKRVVSILPLLLCARPLAAQTPVNPPADSGVPRGLAPPPSRARAPSPSPRPTSSPAARPSASTGPVLLGRVVTPKVAPYVPPAVAQAPATGSPAGCTIRDIARLGRNPTPGELRCRYAARGPGRFGLLSYLDVPVYQPRTPQPGTHVVGVPGMPHPAPGESYEQWEWRVLRTVYGPSARTVHREMALLDPVFAARLLEFERRLRVRGVWAQRRETWRAPERQAFLFQQGRSRPGPIATSTLTSWHNRVDAAGRPSGRAADYEVSSRDLPTFHQVAAELVIESYGADSNDPGHVYLPDTESASGMEIAVLRLLPRVPHVTLETGRPYDERPIPGMPRYWQELNALFLSRWDPFARADVALPPVALGEIHLRRRP